MSRHLVLVVDGAGAYVSRDAPGLAAHAASFFRGVRNGRRGFRDLFVCGVWVRPIRAEREPWRR
jgi:hypothetical protein